MLQLSELLSASKISARHGLPCNEPIIGAMSIVSESHDKINTDRLVDLMTQIQGIAENVIPVNIHSDGMDDVPHIFDVSQIFDMNLEEVTSIANEQLSEKEKKNKFIDNMSSFLENTKTSYKETFFATLPYDRRFFQLSDLSAMNALFKESGVPNLYEEDTFIERDLSCIISQQDLNKPFMNKYISMMLGGQIDWSKDPRTVREILLQEEVYQEGGENHHIKTQLIGDAYANEDEVPAFILHMDFFVRDVTHGPTFINTVVISLNKIGAPLGQFLLNDADSDDSLYDQFVKIAKLVEEDDEVGEAMRIKFGQLFGESKAQNQFVFSLTTDMIFRETVMIKMAAWSILRTLMWMNSKNDIMVTGDTESSRPERKRINRSRKKDKKTEPSFTMKTLKIKDTIVVVEPDGTERPPSSNELAQHTRRGHWAHYGINGNGLFLGKYVKSMYRKPTTIGKFENGIVIKDYELEGTGEEA